MLQIRRTKGREAVDADGRSFALVGETWTVRLTTPWIGFGYSYLRPVAVERTSAGVTIRDHLMVARIAAFVLLAAGTSSAGEENDQAIIKHGESRSPHH